MSFGTYLANGFHILFLNAQAVKETRDDEASFSYGLILLAVLSAIIAGFVALAVTAVGAAWGNTGPLGSAAPLVAFVVVFAIFFFLGIISYGIIHLLAKAFGGTASIKQYFAVALSLSFAGAIVSIPFQLAAYIPYIGRVISFAWSIYTIVASIHAVRETYELSTGRAVAVVLIPVLVVMAVALAFTFLLFGSMLAANI